MSSLHEPGLKAVAVALTQQDWGVQTLHIPRLAPGRQRLSPWNVLPDNNVSVYLVFYAKNMIYGECAFVYLGHAGSV